MLAHIRLWPFLTLFAIHFLLGQFIGIFVVFVSMYTSYETPPLWGKALVHFWKINWFPAMQLANHMSIDTGRVVYLLDSLVWTLLVLLAWSWVRRRRCRAATD